MEELKLDISTLMPLRDVVYKTLRDAILKGELKPGTRLMEIHLANDLGVSRTPVREAIRILEKEGLAVTYPRRGAQVAFMSVKDLEDVMEIREALDVLAAGKACENANEETIEKLKIEVKRFEEALESDDVRHIVEVDEAFHNVIYDSANNPKLKEIVTGLREQMYRYRYEYIKEKSMLVTLLKEHANILKGIENRDKSFVVEAMQEHIENQYDTVKQLIENRDKNKKD